MPYQRNKIICKEVAIIILCYQLMNKVKRMMHNVRIKWTTHDAKNYNNILNTLKKK